MTEEDKVNYNFCNMVYKIQKKRGNKQCFFDDEITMTTTKLWLYAMIILFCACLEKGIIFACF